ncbi:integrase [Lysinibacillus irui]|uniref:Integrase n=1 Tax=Lysinibacillus irui TaxID=2998077 RepID=A0ABU5NT24_9BACI|nr:integrase [Lysinibacillus irui]MEA0556445.1 integrase [Lysinibacillus irui]MEA0979172.1 integrase [Lysinibacillus irui]MEA1045326.1 integrase [Lysinibacillus irui]
MSLVVSNKYELLNWKDRIWKVGPDDKLIPKRDENNQIIYNPLTGQPEYEYLENGTRVNAKRLNHMDEGIYSAHDYIVELKATIRRMQIQMELDGRVPGNSGTFADTLDGSSNKIKLDNALTDIIEAVTAGTTTLKVASVEGFTAFTQITIFDDVGTEDVVITAIGTDTITVQALKNSYKKGAKVARSNVSIDMVNAEMGVGDWQTYNVELVEVV